MDPWTPTPIESAQGTVVLSPTKRYTESELPTGKRVAGVEHIPATIDVSIGAAGRQSTAVATITLEPADGESVTWELTSAVNADGRIKVTGTVPSGSWPNIREERHGTPRNRGPVSVAPLSIVWGGTWSFNAESISLSVREMFFSAELASVLERVFWEAEYASNYRKESVNNVWLPNPMLETQSELDATPHSQVTAYPPTAMAEYYRVWVLAAISTLSDAHGWTADDAPPELSVPARLRHPSGEPIRFRELVSEHHLLRPEAIRDRACRARVELLSDGLISTLPRHDAIESEWVPRPTDGTRRQQIPALSETVEQVAPEPVPPALARSLPVGSHPAAEEGVVSDTAPIAADVADRGTLRVSTSTGEEVVAGTVDLVETPEISDPQLTVLGFTRWWTSPPEAPDPDDIKHDDRTVSTSPYAFTATMAIGCGAQGVVEARLEVSTDGDVTVTVNHEAFLPPRLTDAITAVVRDYAPVPLSPPTGYQDNPYAEAPLTG